MATKSLKRDTKHDYERIAYTAAAISGLCANQSLKPGDSTRDGAERYVEHIATKAHAIANAALKAREEEGE